VGASGDLTPLAHAVGALRGEGEAFWGGGAAGRPSGARARRAAAPGAARRDALGMVNGTSLTAAAAALAVASARRALTLSLQLTACWWRRWARRMSSHRSGTAGGAADHPAGERHRGRAPPALARSNGEVRGAPCRRAYSIRCVPAVVGGGEPPSATSSRWSTDDLNGVSDNPRFFPAERRSSTGELLRPAGRFAAGRAPIWPSPSWRTWPSASSICSWTRPQWRPALAALRPSGPASGLRRRQPGRHPRWWQP